MEKIQIKNFKKIKDECEIDLAPITFLTGTNNSGKSTIIKAILLLQDYFKSQDLFNLNFNGILVNRYENGEDYISAHSDDEKGIKVNDVISISWGQSRNFRIRDKNNKKIIANIPTLSGQIIHMGGEFQREFTHEIPKEKKINGIRYSLTFRMHIK